MPKAERDELLTGCVGPEAVVQVDSIDEVEAAAEETDEEDVVEEEDAEEIDADELRTRTAPAISPSSAGRDRRPDASSGWRSSFDKTRRGGQPVQGGRRNRKEVLRM